MPDGLYDLAGAAIQLKQHADSLEDISAFAAALRHAQESGEWAVVERVLDDAPASMGAVVEWIRAHRSDAMAGAALVVAVLTLLFGDGLLREDRGVRPPSEVVVDDHDDVTSEDIDRLAQQLVEELGRQASATSTSTTVATPPRDEGRRQGPALNSRCYCGSGKKYKKCHGLQLTE